MKKAILSAPQIKSTSTLAVLLLLLSAALLCSHPLGAQTFHSPGGIIANNSVGNCFSQTVTGVGTLTASNGVVRVCLSITQARPADMDISLRSPSGAIISLSTDNGGTSGNDYYEGMCFSDCGPNGSITLGSDFRGVYTPENLLSGFNTGVSGDGVWQLCIDDDNATGGAGKLNYWSITFGSNTPIASPSGETCPTAYPLTTFPFSHTCMSLAGKANDYNDCSGVGDGSEVVYSYTPSVADEYLSMDIAQDWSAPSGFPTISLFNACPSVATPANCIDNQVQMFSYENIMHITSQTLTPGVTYYIVVASSSGTGGTYDIRVEVGRNGDDDCFNATEINTDGEYAGNNYTATIPSTQAPSTAEMTCNGAIDNFIFYTFTTDAVGSTVWVNLTDIECNLSCGGACGIQIALFRRPAGGPCLGAGTWGAPVFCEASTTTNQYYEWSGLLPNTQYYIMVDGNAGSQCVWNLRMMGDFQEALPVEFGDITVAAEGVHNAVKWTTHEEVNVNYYEVEHGLSPSSFTTAGRVTARGAGSSINTYTFDDAVSQPGWHYYRIRNVDIDGRNSTSKVVSIFRSRDETFVQLFPNPAQNEINLSVSAQGNTEVTLRNLSGMELRSFTFTASDAVTLIPVDITGLPRGIYLMQVTTGDGNTVTRKFSKM